MIDINATWQDLKTKEQWRQWLDLAAEEAPEYADWWSTAEGCADCRHFDSENVWCNLVSAPASRNPVTGLLGMACCGLGYEPEPGTQLRLFYVP